MHTKYYLNGKHDEIPHISFLLYAAGQCLSFQTSYVDTGPIEGDYGWFENNNDGFGALLQVSLNDKIQDILTTSN